MHRNPLGPDPTSPHVADRIASLVPAATEILFELGLGDRVTARSHACDHPEAVLELPAATRTRIETTGSSKEIDEAVRAQVASGEPMFQVLEEVLHHAEADLVIVQEACAVCGITPADVGGALSRIEPGDWPEILSLHPHTLEDVLDEVGRVADAAGQPRMGELVRKALAARIETVRSTLADVDQRPRVVVLDWLDPPMVAGHWVPGMVEIAGGEPALVEAGEPSQRTTWSEIGEAAPEILVLAPCGLDSQRTREQATSIQAPDGCRVLVLDGDDLLSRPGPRLVEALEAMARAFQPAAAARGVPLTTTNLRPL